MGNVCSGESSFNNKSSSSSVKVNQEFDFRYKNLKAMKRSFQDLLTKVRLASEMMRDAPVKLSGVGEGYSGVYACLHHSGSGVTESTINHNHQVGENNNDSRGQSGAREDSPAFDDVKEPYGKGGDNYGDRFENLNVQMLDREVAREDYHSSQALTAAFLKIRDEEYVHFSQNVNDKVLSKVQELQKELEVVTEHGRTVVTNFNKYREARKKKEKIEKDFEKKGKPLSESTNYTSVSKQTTDADALFKESLFDFDKKYEALLLNSQRTVRTSRDDFLDECESYLKSIVDLVTVVEA